MIKPLHSEFLRISQYVCVRDGTRLAVDIYLPAVKGIALPGPYPVLWMHTRYQRAWMLDGQVKTHPSNLEMVYQGYIVAVVDARGSGASFGVRRGEFTPEEAQDAYDITQWLAAQPWSSGKIGMIGRSMSGNAQFFAAAQQPLALKAIFPEMHIFDIFRACYHNGLYVKGYFEAWDKLVADLDSNTSQNAAPVDADPQGRFLKSAIRMHSANGYSLARSMPHRDSTGPANFTYSEASPGSYIDSINKSGIAVYQVGGWFDNFPDSLFLWFTNLTVPQKLAVAPWAHAGREEWLLEERIRWFDYWLKGIDNGIMSAPPIRYYVMSAGQWCTSSAWPLQNEIRRRAYFHSGPSDSIDSIQDGLLSFEMPESPSGKDSFQVDYSISMGEANRFAAAAGKKFVTSTDMAFHDRHSLTYTTAPLQAGVEITGHPVAHIWVTSSEPDMDLFVYLEDVDENGVSLCMTEGKLRASHRALSTPPFHNMGLPWLRGCKQDIRSLERGTPTELVFDLMPTSNLFKAGHRIRIAITGADADTFETLLFNPPPHVMILHSRDYASFIELPVIIGDVTHFTMV